MRDLWRIGLGLDLRVTAGSAAADGEVLPAGQAATWLRWTVDDGPRGHATLLEIAEVVTGTAPSPRMTRAAAMRAVEHGLSTGRLQVIASRDHEGGGKGPVLDEPKTAPRPVREDKTFVAIELLSDEAEPKPVPFKRYRIELPDHTVREGQLDQYGRAQIVGIDPGNCQVSFPDFDAADWKAA